MSRATQGTIFDIKRYAIHDGPGIRTTAFLKGCPIRCRWCANPESQKTSCEIAHNPDDCIQCGKCEQICPENAIALIGDSHTIDDRCTSCGKCVAVCPGDALEVMGRALTADALLEEMITDAPFWERSSGGVTLSGGEPLFQAEFTAAFLSICKDNFIHTAVESCLHFPKKILDDIQPFADHFIFDLKIMDDDKHKQFTGVSNHRILENAARLLSADQDLLVRMPLIPGVNDDPVNLGALGEFLQTHRPGVELELLPFHRLGISKYQRLGRTCSMADILPPSKGDMEKALTLLQNFKIQLVKR